MDALHDISLDIDRGECLAILGGDGAGKSTFAKLLNGIIPQMEKGTLTGEVIVNDRRTDSTPISELVQKVGLALQDPDTQLFTGSVEEEVAFGPENFGMPVAEIERNIASALTAMGLSSQSGKSPGALSGGQKQRLIIAAILSMNPDVIVLDEPFSMLDPRGRMELMTSLKKLRKERLITIIVTSQDAEDVHHYCDRIALLHKGRLIEIDAPEKVLRSSEKLTAIGVEPPELLNLSERLVKENLLSPDKIFIEEEAAVRALRFSQSGGDA